MLLFLRLCCVPRVTSGSDAMHDFLLNADPYLTLATNPVHVSPRAEAAYPEQAKRDTEYLAADVATFAVPAELGQEKLHIDELIAHPFEHQLVNEPQRRDHGPEHVQCEHKCDIEYIPVKVNAADVAAICRSR